MAGDAQAVLLAGVSFYCALRWRALRTFVLTHRHADMLVVPNAILREAIAV